ncbi:MAG TPA: NUDIX domain-containing protein [Candidatus Saccharimonadales bacterium]|jgi:isopentenyl-diphosphate delta-isomerase
MFAKILIVDKDNKAVGSASMDEAHLKGLAHRIVRVFLFNTKGQVFLQKRSSTVSFPGLWDQSVGGHVDEGEDNLQAAKRETEEEVGLKDLELHEVGTYYSEATLPNGQLKRFNILYTAISDVSVTLDPDEVESGKWVTLEELDQLIKDKPEDFTGGLIRALEFYRENKTV